MYGSKSTSQWMIIAGMKEEGKTALVERIYAMRFAQSEAYRNRVWKTLIAGAFQKYIKKEDSVLDLGCGYCVFINNIDCGSKFGIDLNPTAMAMASSEVTILSQDTAEPWAIEDAGLDVVFTSNFLEHLPSKAHVEETLRHAYKALKPGGLLIAMGPNVRLVPGQYWDYWDHHVAITDLSLSECLSAIGYRIQECYPAFLPFTIVNQRPAPTFLIAMYLRCRILWKLLGKQFLVVARKPGP